MKSCIIKNGIVKNHLSKLAVIFFSLSLSNHALANEADCIQVYPWAEKGYEWVKNERGGFHQGNRIIKALEDEYFIPVFHKSLTEFSESDLGALQTHLNTCHKAGRELAHKASKAGDRATGQGYVLANQFIASVLRSKLTQNVPSNFINTMLNQQGNLVKRKAAISDAERALSKARSLAANSDSLLSLAQMKVAPYLVFLSEEHKSAFLDEITSINTGLKKQLEQQQITAFDSYEDSLAGLEAFLQDRKPNRRTRERMRGSQSRELEMAIHAKLQGLSEAAISDAVNQLKGFDSTLEGLRSLIKFQQRVTLALRQTKAMGNYRFDKAYKTKLDELATASLKEFEQELKSYAANKKSLTTINRAVQSLFSQQPLPANIDQYRKVAMAQAESMQIALTKQRCYQAIAGDQIDMDDLDVGLLDGKGASTLGLFVCRLDDRGYELISYQAPGFIGNTHVLKVKTPRGITLTLNLEPLEVNEGEELLVGVLAKDVSQETEFTIAQWQDYAQQLIP